MIFINCNGCREAINQIEIICWNILSCVHIVVIAINLSHTVELETSLNKIKFWKMKKKVNFRIGIYFLNTTLNKWTNWGDVLTISPTRLILIVIIEIVMILILIKLWFGVSTLHFKVLAIFRRGEQFSNAVLKPV